MKKKIIKLLKELEKEQGIKILMAVESGSREWGFESKDSDYDVRCVHISDKNSYLGLEDKKEQVDLIKEDIDIVSWDIRKFFRLFLKSNPTVSEWLSSKLVYIDKGFGEYKKKDILKIFEEGYSRSKLEHHYISLAMQNYKKYIDSYKKDVLLKKYVYILRALGCIEYINETNELPPLNWKKSSKYLPKDIKEDFNRLVEMKKSSEKNKGKRIKRLDNYIEKNLRQEIKEDKERFNFDVINKIVIDSIK